MILMTLSKKKMILMMSLCEMNVDLIKTYHLNTLLNTKRYCVSNIVTLHNKLSNNIILYRFFFFFFFVSLGFFFQFFFFFFK